MTFTTLEKYAVNKEHLLVHLLFIRDHKIRWPMIRVRSVTFRVQFRILLFR